MTSLPPGSTIGILGGGQLGRMLAIAAANLGYRCHIYAPPGDNVASHVAAETTLAAYDDIDALTAFASVCDVVTYEFENVPVAPLRAIEKMVPIRPGIAALELAQDREREKRFACEQGGQTAAFGVAHDEGAMAGAMQASGYPAILKTIRMGYDGKGQARVAEAQPPADLWKLLDGQPLIAEAMIGFDAEFSVILVRGGDGKIAFWDSTRNVHEDGILAHSSLPAGPLIEGQVSEARKLAASIAEALAYVGVLTLEFFACDDVALFNEMAPRVHNSGHWTIEGAVTSQFENHIRAVCGLPLGDTATISARVEMENLIGDDAARYEAILADDEAHLHLYGKAEARPGRKIGHVTRLYW